jgi:hypothetical protein
VAITVPNVVKVTGSGVTTVTTSGVTTTTGGTFVAWSTADDGVTINKPTDSKSNDYGTAKVTVSTGGGSSKQTVYVKENGAGGASHTLTFTYGSATYPTVFFIECAGASTASYDSGSLTSGASGAGSPFNRNSGGQAQAANAILTFCATDAGGSLTYANSGYTVSQESDGNNYWTGAIGRQIVNTTSAVTSSWTVSASNGGTVTFAIKEAAGGTSYDLTVDPASYSLTAAAETVTATRALTISPASYALTAANVNLAVGRAVNFAPASYTLTAAAETLTATRALSIDPASYSLTNSAVTLSVGRVVSVDPVAYTLTTSAETLTVARQLNIAPAAYVLTAADVTLDYASANPVLSVDPVSYTLSASDVTFEFTGGVQLLGGGPGGPRKRRGGTESYLERLLGRPLDEIEPEEIEVIEQAAEEAAKAPQPPKREEAEESLREYGLALKEAYVQIFIELEQKKRQAMEEEEMMAVIAVCL